MANYGLGSLVQTFAPPTSQAPSSSPFTPVRVIDVILDDKNPNFKDQGAWDSIGTIQFRPIYLSSTENNKDKFLFAKPFFSNIKHYPLKNEIVFILFLPNQNTENTFDGSYYYIDTINIWSSIHHNALPDVNNPENYTEDQKRDYIPTAAGASRQITDSSSDINLGNTFKERTNVHSLLPYEGDTIIEGRWGQSVRFGSTVTNSNIKNLWSETGNNGDPITIIRNNQPLQSPKGGWIPITEDINQDGSSIYMGSKQTLPIIVASTNQKSFNTIIATSNPENIILPNITPTLPQSESISSTDAPVISSPNPRSAALPSTPISSSNVLSTSQLDEVEISFSGDVVELEQQKEVGDIIYNKLENSFYDAESDTTPNLTLPEVPWERQQAGTWCFIACCAMLSKYFKNPSPQSSISKNYNDVNGNLISTKFWKSKGKTITKFNLPGGNSGYNVLISKINEGKSPFILERKSISAPGDSDRSHFVVVLGINPKGEVIVNDPASKTGGKTILRSSNLKPSNGTYRIIK